MAAIKEIYTKDLFANLACQITSVYPQFTQDKFIQEVFCDPWDTLEMIQRTRQGAAALVANLPESLEACIQILLTAAPYCDPALGLVLTEFIVLKGIDHLEASAGYMMRITQDHSAEFAVRPFIEKYQDKMMDILLTWAGHPHEEVRRLSSEGSRIKLPWGSSIHYLGEHPAKILPILEKLKNDSSPYVRKSVANNLNEISKTDPALAYSTACSWLGQTPETDRVIKHGCRTLLKQNYPGIRSLFQLELNDFLSIHYFKICTREVAIGNDLEFTFTIKNSASNDIRTDIRYELSFRNPSGRTITRQYKITERNCPAGFLLMNRKHQMVSTSGRQLYPGLVQLHILINGQRLSASQFTLVTPFQ